METTKKLKSSIHSYFVDLGSPHILGVSGYWDNDVARVIVYLDSKLPEETMEEIEDTLTYIMALTSEGTFEVEYRYPENGSTLLQDLHLAYQRPTKEEFFLFRIRKQINLFLFRPFRDERIRGITCTHHKTNLTLIFYVVHLQQTVEAEIMGICAYMRHMFPDLMIRKEIIPLKENQALPYHPFWIHKDTSN